ITTMILVIFFASVPFISEQARGGFSSEAHATTNDTPNEGKASLRDNGTLPLDHSATEHSVAAQKESIRPKIVCPPPTIADGTQCIITHDVALNATIHLATNKTLDCGGHRISPTSVGSSSARSKPEVGIFLDTPQM